MTADPRIDTAELLALIDRLEALLQSAPVSELEVEVEGMGLVLRTQAALSAPPVQAATTVPAQAPAPAAEPMIEESSRTQAVLAPLTGLYYSAPSPGAEPYVQLGSEVHVGQVIGLIEAMKLFNEIKSDVGGRVVRICVEDGGLVKAKQPLLELEPI